MNPFMIGCVIAFCIYSETQSDWIHLTLLGSSSYCHISDILCSSVSEVIPSWEGPSLFSSFCITVVNIILPSSAMIWIVCWSYMEQFFLLNLWAKKKANVKVAWQAEHSLNLLNFKNSCCEQENWPNTVDVGDQAFCNIILYNCKPIFKEL